MFKGGYIYLDFAFLRFGKERNSIRSADVVIRKKNPRLGPA